MQTNGSGHRTPGSPQRRRPGFALCLTYHLPNISGLTLSAHALARHLATLEYPVRVIAGRVPADAPAREVIDGVEVIRSRAVGRLGKALVMPGYPLALWRALEGVAVVNVHLPCLDAATVAIVAKLRGCKLIVSYISSMSRERMLDRFMRGAGCIPHVVAGLLADSIQVVSHDYAAESTFCRIFRHKLVMAPLPVPLALSPGERRPLRLPRKATAEAPFRIAYVGRIARQKSLGVLLAAVPRLAALLGSDNFVIELAGPGSDVVGESSWQEILSEAQRSGGTVVYVGVKAGRELADYYASLDVLVLPSTDRLESFGLVQVEAMLRQVPVVASDLPGMRLPVASTGMGRLFKPGDSVALADAVAEVLLQGPPQNKAPDEIEALFGHAVACAPYYHLLRAVELDTRNT